MDIDEATKKIADFVNTDFRDVDSLDVLGALITVAGRVVSTALDFGEANRNIAPLFFIRVTSAFFTGEVQEGRWAAPFTPIVSPSPTKAAFRAYYDQTLELVAFGRKLAGLSPEDRVNVASFERVYNVKVVR